MRAPTPSAAAELAVPDMREISAYISDFRYTLKKELIAVEGIKRSELEALKKRLNIKHYIESRELLLDKTETAMFSSFDAFFEKKKNALALSVSALSALDPLSVIKRGYAVVYKDGKPLASAKEAKKNDRLFIKMKDGEINCVAE